MLSKKSFFIFFSLLLFDISPAFATLVPLTGVTKITGGQSYNCVLLSTGGVQCWGNNGPGQLGNGTTISSTVPVAVTGLSSGVTAISGSYVHACALLNTGGVQCWGGNETGQLGNNTTTDSSTPVTVTGLSSGVIAIAANNNHTCALLSTGGVQCWGSSK